MEISKILLCSSVIASFVVSGIESISYEQLNVYLTKRVKGHDDVGSNMKAAVDLLDEQRATKRLFSSKTRSDDLKKFVALQQIINDSKCDGEAYEIMRANEEAIGLHKLNDGGKVSRRIDIVIMDIFKSHSLKCSPNYPIIYRSKLKQLDKTAARCVGILARAVMKADGLFIFNSQNLFSHYVKSNYSLKALARNDILRNALFDSAEGDLGTKGFLRRKSEFYHPGKIKDLAKEYLIEPCKLFVARFGPDLFVPAKFDALSLHEVDNNNGDYYLGWSYFTICQTVQENESAVIDDLVKSIEADD